MKKIFVVGCISLFLFIYFPATNATDSWLNIVQPSPGIYFHGEKIIPLKSAVVLIGTPSIHVVAEGSDNIFSVYFALYSISDKSIVDSFWDINKNDGWSYDFDVPRGLYALMAAGSAIDIEEPVAVDWLTIIAF